MSCGVMCLSEVASAENFGTDDKAVFALTFEHTCGDWSRIARYAPVTARIRLKVQRIEMALELTWEGDICDVQCRGRLVPLFSR